MRCLGCCESFGFLAVESNDAGIEAGIETEVEVEIDMEDDVSRPLLPSAARCGCCLQLIVVFVLVVLVVVVVVDVVSTVLAVVAVAVDLQKRASS